VVVVGTLTEADGRFRLNCLACCEDQHFVAVFQCNHAVLCALCTLRNFCLFDDRKCPMCKQEQADVVIAQCPVQPYGAYFVPGSTGIPAMAYDAKLRAYFHTQRTAILAANLMQSWCWVCAGLLPQLGPPPPPPPLSLSTTKQPTFLAAGQVDLAVLSGIIPEYFPTKSAFQSHVDRVHNRTVCRVCLDDRKVRRERERERWRLFVRCLFFFGRWPCVLAGFCVCVRVSKRKFVLCLCVPVNTQVLKRRWAGALSFCRLCCVVCVSKHTQGSKRHWVRLF
jgi:hypothetical protein